MTTAEVLQALDKTLKANARRPVATRPLMDRSACTDPNCDCCRKGTR